MEKKEHYKHILPHYQQPGQAYFVTWSLKDAVPPKALKRYTQKQEELKNQIELYKSNNVEKIKAIENEIQLVRKKYIEAFNYLLDGAKKPKIDLSKAKNIQILKEAISFWVGKKLTNFAYCIMPNHVHWVFQLFEKEENGNTVYLQDIMHSVKRFSSNEINKQVNRTGPLWQKESFDTTIRNETHLYYALEYTLNNPVAAGYVNDWRDWPGAWSLDW